MLHVDPDITSRGSVPPEVAVSPRVVAVASVVSVVVVVVAVACATGGKGGKGADPARGAKYFQTKCNACHPNGGVGAGPALLGKTPPGPLKKSSAGGRHNVPDDEWDALIAYITPMMVPGAAAAATVPAAAGATTPAATPVPAVPAAAPPGMKNCNCTCQCPLGTPPGAMQNCTCACTCPPG